MPFRTVPATSTRYALVAFDKSGAERNDDGDGDHGLLSSRLLAETNNNPPSDIFLFSHGWRGDVAAAIDQYDRWIGAMNRLNTGIARMGPGFRPAWIGIHWPSEPWGEEELQPVAAFAVSGNGAGVPQVDLQEKYLARLGLEDSAEARSLLDIIFETNRVNAAARKLPEETASAYKQLAALLGFGPGNVASEPGADHTTFDPQQAFDALKTNAAFGGALLGGVLAPLRTLSFWTMKRRARSVGESGVNGLVAQLQAAAPQARLHLMGHSFGCIVMSSVCGGLNGTSALPRPIDSLALIQGALSLWAYAGKIPSTGGTGYFNAMLRRPAVRGPIITTQSIHDTAVGVIYPKAVGLVLQNPNFAATGAPLPKWGAIGAFGIQGAENTIATPMLDTDHTYNFENGCIYNVEASQFIEKMSGLSGAHSDIDGPQVAHALWQAAWASNQAGTQTAKVKVASFSVGAGDVGPTVASMPALSELAVQPRTAATPPSFGVQAETGAYLPAISAEALLHIDRDPASIRRRLPAGTGVFGVTASVDAGNLAQAGWGIIFPKHMQSADVAAVENALEPLLALRKSQAGARFWKFSGENGYAGEPDADEWLSQHGSALSIVDPTQGVPYYLLLVGSPDDIPFEFQYDLDSFFAVGRLYFETAEEYAEYARKIVAFETADAPPNGKNIALFVTRNPGDAATAMLHDLVGTAFADGDPGNGFEPLGQSQGYARTKFLADNASKNNLVSLLSGKSEAGIPALLFTGSHGVSFSLNDPALNQKQGAILTKEWKGPNTPVSPDTYLTAAELPNDANLSGTIHFFFACYSAGCPEFDTYSYQGDKPAPLARAAIIARLPQRILLAGAQAVIGHIDRAWAYGFQSAAGTTTRQNLADPLVRILRGDRVGHALDSFNQRWSVASNALLKMRAQRDGNPASVSEEKLTNKWIERDDARNYIILGDPAARVAIARSDEQGTAR